jgi:uncharacterized protein YcaQ
VGGRPAQAAAGALRKKRARLRAMQTTLSLAALRRHVVAWQAFTGRHRRAGDDEVAACVGRLSCVQLDAIATVERSHLLVLGARLGAVAPGAVSRLLASGRLFEYWAHEACLLAVEDWPLWRRRMRERRTHHWWGPVIASNPELAKRILGEIRERGPLGSRHFEGDPGRGMWRRKPAKQMLDALWTAGALVVCGRQGFQRLYDLPERVIPAPLLEAPVPSEKETLRRLVLRAVQGRGALTAAGIVDHYRLKGGTARLAPHLKALCRDGLLRHCTVDDGGPPVYLPAEAEIGAGALPNSGVLLSPFENMLWDRAFTRRLFGFDHRIEIYKRAHERAYGYYVLPFLLGERLVGRADLKSDREAGEIRVKAFHLEAGVRRSGRIDASFQSALARLARALGLASAKRERGEDLQAQPD